MKPIVDNIVVQESKNLYKWATIFNRLQRNFFIEEVKLRREKQIEDFVLLNGFKRIKMVTDTDILASIKNKEVRSSVESDLVIITDQKFSRYPCPVLIQKIEWYLTRCPNLYLCLNRHYINIDNSYHDTELDANFNLAITQWLKKNLTNTTIIDLSLDYIDYGQAFTWAIPDRQYFITKHD
jgi:hypothetical protein